jgi:hypothetical protein
VARGGLTATWFLAEVVGNKHDRKRARARSASKNLKPKAKGKLKAGAPKTKQARPEAGHLLLGVPTSSQTAGAAPEQLIGTALLVLTRGLGSALCLDARHIAHGSGWPALALLAACDF